MKKLFRRVVRKLSWRFLLGYTLFMFTIGAVPVFAGYFAVYGVHASTIAIVVVTVVAMLAIIGVIVVTGEFLKRRLLSRLDETEP
jgi:Na+/melibiose symporter-like transporter